MRNRRLHDSLREFALESAKHLRAEQEAGAELEFDLDEGSVRSGPTLYHYRPLTGRFIAERWHALSELPSCGPAAEQLGSGAASYLRMNGQRGAEAEPALRAMLERLYEDVTDFTFPEERFERVYAEVERTLYEETQSAAVLVPVFGMVLEGMERVELADGLCLVPGEATDAPDEAVWGEADGRYRQHAAHAHARRGARRPAALRGGARGLSGTCSPACGCGSPAAWRSAPWHGGAPATVAGSRSS